MRIIAIAILAVPFLVTSVAAQDMPTRKAGLWALTMNFENSRIPTQNMKQCVDAETDKLMNSPSGGMGREQCSKKNVQQSGNTIIVDSTCQFSGMTTTAHAVVSGDFNSAYTVQVESKREGGPSVPGMPATTKMTISAKYLGGCEAGQKPGDMIVEGGMKINVRDMQNMRGNGPPGGPPGMPGRPGMPPR